MFEAIRKHIRGAVLATGVMMACMPPAHAQQAETEGQSAGTVTVSAQTMERLQQHLAQLEAEVTELKAQMNEIRSAAPSTMVSIPNARPAHSTGG